MSHYFSFIYNILGYSFYQYIRNSYPAGLFVVIVEFQQVLNKIDQLNKRKTFSLISSNFTSNKQELLIELFNAKIVNQNHTIIIVALYIIKLQLALGQSQFNVKTTFRNVAFNDCISWIGHSELTTPLELEYLTILLLRFVLTFEYLDEILWW